MPLPRFFADRRGNAGNQTPPVPVCLHRQRTLPADVAASCWVETQQATSAATSAATTRFIVHTDGARPMDGSHEGAATDPRAACTGHRLVSNIANDADLHFCGSAVRWCTEVFSEPDAQSLDGDAEAPGSQQGIPLICKCQVVAEDRGWQCKLYLSHLFSVQGHLGERSHRHVCRLKPHLQYHRSGDDISATSLLAKHACRYIVKASLLCTARWFAKAPGPKPDAADWKHLVFVYSKAHPPYANDMCLVRHVADCNCAVM